METLLAKALFDNVAECPDELAFRKSDIVTVMDQNVVGSRGWWKCSLYGRQGLAPANRLQILPKVLSAEHSKSPNCQNSDSPQNIYQIPSGPRLSTTSSYECMDRIYKIPSSPLSKSPLPSPLKKSTEILEGNSKALAPSILSSPKGEVYDVPSLGRGASLLTPSQRQPLERKASLIKTSELERRFHTLGIKSDNSSDSYVYAVPPPVSQDPSYDIPVPSSTEAQQRLASGYNTLPNPRKSEWIYDVPMSPEKPGHEQGYNGTMPSKVMSPARQLYDTLPAHVWPVRSPSSALSLYDIPKPCSNQTRKDQDAHSPPTVIPRVPTYDKPPVQKLSEDSVYAVPPQEQSSIRRLSDSYKGHVPLECRGDTGPNYDHSRGRMQRGRMDLVSASLRNRPGTRGSLVQEEDKRSSASHMSATDSQRSSTASSSSTSSCDSLALSSSSPEPLREVTLSQEEVGRRLLVLQEAVCRAVPKLMDFVSSRWRSKEHLGKHLKEIKGAAERITCSVTVFLDFALDLKGNARRLTDANLQARLNKQLSILEDSGLILQKAMSALNVAGWPLDTLSQDPGQAQTPDPLERFVMVARTVPEDVKRLVSILNANGKLLFRSVPREPDNPNSTILPETKKCHNETEQLDDLVEDENDYVQLQTKTEFEKQQKIAQGKPMIEPKGGSKKPKEDQPQPSQEAQVDVEGPRRAVLPEHCRLYFGALQKAISAFVNSLVDGQPPENFISHSKLVIMVGQRLVNTLCREAHSGETSQSLLCQCNHLCALLKQLAVATKKAALHFPDTTALDEAQNFAKELAQQAQHFRNSLDI
ncbi:cas scaffolding protein family member 4 [Hypomesus transpacificus]|uniref:cas scaffolding protein family member 4 n=1 Tax=Hypomesus transpacificus TaxID=137520 RepID=UPI001F07C35A|nr:cas scaffolding protein family member 4 [Hypomesus transpacificus]